MRFEQLTKFFPMRWVTLVIVVLLTIVGLSFLSYDNVALAQTSVPTYDQQEEGRDREEQTEKKLLERFKDTLATSFKTSLGIFLNQFAQDTAVWIASGGKGQKPLFITEGWGAYLRSASDRALGEFVEDVGNGLNDLYQESVNEYRQDQLVDTLGDEGHQDYLELLEQERQQCNSAASSAERQDCFNSAKDNALRDAFIFNDDEAAAQYEACVAEVDALANSLTTEEFNSFREQCANEITNPLTSNFSSQAFTNFGLDGLGRVVNAFTSDLCSPSSLNFSLNITLTLGRQDQRGCTFSQIRDNISRTIDTADFTVNFGSYFNRNENDLGIALTLIDRRNSTENRRKNEETLRRLTNQGINDVESGVSNIITTPATLVSDAVKEGFRKAGLKEGTFTGTIADAVNTFVTTLVGTYLNRLGQGLVDNTDQDENFRSGSGFEALTNFTSAPAAAGASGAKIRFRAFKEVDFSGSGAFQIINELATCSDISNPGPTNCVISENFRDAVIEGITVREALESGNLDGDLPLGFIGEGIEPSYREGYPYRSLVILRKHRIIPVGWELAALYIKNFSGETATLRTVVDNFDNPESPFYKLIDPNWVLKSPENFCSLEGAGPIITNETVLPGLDRDDDGDFDDEGDRRPDIRLTRDSNYCADERSCLETNEDGSCKFFGYCTQDRPIFDFQGETCDPVFNTCQTYRDPDGASVSYLENTLDFEGCTSDNAGCRWYCEDQNPNDGSWACNETTGSRINFDNDAESCPADAAGCRRYVDTSSGAGANILTNGNFELFEGTPDDGAADALTGRFASTIGEITSDSLFGNFAFQLQGLLNIPIDTGVSVRGRTFVLISLFERVHRIEFAGR